MSKTENACEVEKYEFKWGKRRGIGGKKKEVQFYESFTYDGTEYSLYDSVYLYKDGEPKPYIGKLVKMWEQPQEKKKVKVLWFFHPDEIRNWLEDGTTLENEIFLACGDGTGLANINPLEAIAGKCHVVCTSKDSRNPQPSPEELRMADYIFYRTFDVGRCIISDKIDDTIAGIDVRYLCNREGIQQLNAGTEHGVTNKDGNGNMVASNSVAVEDKDERPANNIVSDLGAEIKGTEVHSNPSCEKTVSRPITEISLSGQKKLKSSNDLGVSENKPFKKARLDGSATLSKEPSTSHLVGDNKDKNENLLQKNQSANTSKKDVLQASEKAGIVNNDKKKPRLEKSSLKQVSSKDKLSKLSNGTLSKTAAAHAKEKISIPEGQELEVTRRPALENDRSKWFEPLDIIWSAFRESCTAKVVPHTSTSSPHSGQAFVIFKSRDMADTAVRKLDEGCLMLPNGRPLVASWGSPPNMGGKPSSFIGHLAIDKTRLQSLRNEHKQAISTSHCSQPNTIEFDMAMEWCLLQTQSESIWEELYKRHGNELRKLKATLKSSK
ncbi:hypothetical protein ACHQM5_017343 [Ranunculus cassubicifolius]